MITSKDNPKLALVRRLADRKHRDREGLFAAEGEDLLEAGRAAGEHPELVLSVPGSGIDGLEVSADALASASTLGSGTRVISVWRQRWSPPTGPVCVYLHAIGDPGNVGAIIRTAHALVEGSVVLGPDCADPHSPKAVRASMGSVFGLPLGRGSIDQTPRPRFAMVAEGGETPGEVPDELTLCLGAERLGLPAEVLDACDRRWTIPLHEPGGGGAGAESLNVAAAAAIALGRISSAAAEGES